MSTYTRRRHSPQGQYNIAGKRQGNVYTQAQHGVVPGRRAAGVDRPFPNKPVSHRRTLNSRAQDSLNLYDFEKITITKQPRGPLSSQEHHSSGIRDTTGSQQHPRKDSHRTPRGELQMARAIHAKELMLQEKLWRVEEKIRQRIQEDSVEAAAGDNQKSEEERPDRRQAERGTAQTKTRLSEQQRRQPVRSREMMQERRREDVKQLRKRQDHRNEHTMRNTHEKETARWKRREIEVAQSPQLQRKGRKGIHEVTVHGQEASRELNKLRWENVKEHTRRKGKGEKDSGIWGEIGVEANEREQNTTSVGDKGWTKDKKCRERTCKEMYGSDDNRDMPQISHRAATENHTGAGRKLSGGPLLPPVSGSSLSSSQEQGEDRLKDSTYDGLQLLPCRICNRKFASKRLEVHVQICKKMKQSHRQVFNSYANRTKGSAIEEFWKTHSRTKTPEVLKKKKLNKKADTRNLQEGRRSAGPSQPKWSK